MGHTASENPSYHNIGIQRSRPGPCCSFHSLLLRFRISRFLRFSLVFGPHCEEKWVWSGWYTILPIMRQRTGKGEVNWTRESWRIGMLGRLADSSWSLWARGAIEVWVLSDPYSDWLEGAGGLGQSSIRCEYKSKRHSLYFTCVDLWQQETCVTVDTVNNYRALTSCAEE